MAMISKIPDLLAVRFEAVSVEVTTWMLDQFVRAAPR